MSSGRSEKQEEYNSMYIIKCNKVQRKIKN